MTQPDAGILILAAGAASRFGSPKALARWGRSTLLSHAIGLCADVRRARCLVVLGSHAERLRDEMSHAAATFNPDWRQGLGTSIAWGARALLEKDVGLEILVILPVDQPLVTATHLQTLIECARQTQRCAFTRDGEAWGVPAAVPRSYFPTLKNLAGDRGLKAVLRSDDCVFREGAGMLADIDTPADMERLRARTAKNIEPLGHS